MKITAKRAPVESAYTVVIGAGIQRVWIAEIRGVAQHVDSPSRVIIDEGVKVRPTAFSIEQLIWENAPRRCGNSRP